LKLCPSAFEITLAEGPRLIADYRRMEIPLEDLGRRRIALGVSLVIAAVLIFQAGEISLASHRLDSEKLALMERGAAMLPGDGSAWDRLGRLRQWDFADSDLSGAIDDYQRAVRDDPRSAHFWMDLASAYETSGDDARAREAYLRAKSVYPASAEVAFHYGNFLLREQQYPEAFRELQRAARTDPTLLPLVISRAWRSSEDINELLDSVLPADADAYSQALDFFASIHQAQPALAVWQRLLGLGKPFPLPRTFPFFDELIHEDRADDARRAWLEALAAAGLPHDEPPGRNLVWNGNFAQDFENGGLDWRWTPPMGVTMEVDFELAPNGSHAIRLDFNGGSNLGIDEPSQYVPVEPNRAYHFHGYMRTEQITTESGMRFSVTDPNHAGAINVLADNFTGSRAWTSVDADLTTGPATHVLLVRLFREPSRLFENKLEGTVWIADVSLTPSSAQAGPTSR
jgi:tetratricopeptide (TPR) repeat protein